MKPKTITAKIVVQISRSLFALRHKTWPARVWIVNLSWIPLWHLRKHVPISQISWTPAATIRSLSEKVKSLEAESEHRWKKWHECEMELRAERMARASDGMTEVQKKWANDVMGVRFSGSEAN